MRNYNYSLITYPFYIYDQAIMLKGHEDENINERKTKKPLEKNFFYWCFFYVRVLLVVMGT